MTDTALYEVVGNREVRGHKEGDRFFARIEPAVESRWVRIGRVRVISRTAPTVEECERALPEGWLTG